MTLAICRKCGHEKLGAISPCDQCGFLPESPREQAESIFLSDHFFSKEDLETAAKRIRNGQEVQFDEEQLAEFEQTIRSTPKPNYLGCTIIWWCLLMVMFSLLALVTWALWYAKAA